MEERWTKIDEQSAVSAAISYEDYINETKTIIHRVWNDGYVEEFEIEKEMWGKQKWRKS